MIKNLLDVEVKHGQRRHIDDPQPVCLARGKVELRVIVVARQVSSVSRSKVHQRAFWNWFCSCWVELVAECAISTCGHRVYERT